jgi:proline iminopeptidase
MKRFVSKLLLLSTLAPCLAHAANPMLSAGPHDADLGDVRLHYVVAGSGPIVLATSPGWGVSSAYLQNGLTPLESRFTMVFIDTRGSGGSTRPADRAQMSESVMADDIEKLRVLLGLDSIRLLGHSDGGAIALDYAERHPEHVRKLLLIAPGILGDRPMQAIAAYLKLWADDPHYRSAVQEQAKKDPPDLTDEEFEIRLHALLPLYFADPQRYLPVFEKTLEGMHPSAYAQQTEVEAKKKEARDQTKDYGKVRAQTLIMNGTVDWICPYEAAQRAQAGIAGSQLSLYANKGHFLWIEDPDRFFAEALAFFGD